MKAVEAQQLLDNQLFKDSFKSVREGLISALGMVDMVDRDKQQAITLGFQILGQIETHIKAHIADGQINEFNLEAKRRFEIM